MPEPGDETARGTIRSALAGATRALLDAGVPDAALDAEWLLADVLGVDRGALLARRDDPLAPHCAVTFDTFVTRRAQRVPLQHVLGRQEFYGRPFRVDGRVLIPRQETEVLIDAVLARRDDDARRLVDLGTGSGCLAITLLLERPAWSAVAVERSEDALELARENAGSSGVHARIDWLDGDFARAAERAPFDVIVSNPPYVGEAEWLDLQPEVRDGDPREALVAGPTGFEAYRDLLPLTWRIAAPGTLLALEVGQGQDTVVRRLAEAAGWSVETIVPDLTGTPRTLIAERTA